MTTQAIQSPPDLGATAPWPFFADDEIRAAAKVLQSGKVNYWTGDEGRRFEDEFAAFTGCGHAIALMNGTVALELALRVLGVGPGDEVITTPRTFIASASCAVAVGARPVLADVDRESGNITVETIERVLSPRTAAIIAVHLGGWPCDMDPMVELARHRGLRLIEDCAQAHGATYKGRPVGALGDVAAFSFCQDKIMTTAGEGGMLTVDSTEMYETAWAYKDHGKSYDAVYRRQHGPGFRWLHESWGSNWRLTEVQAAIGRIQLRKLEDWVNVRRRHAGVLNDVLADLDAVRVTIPPPEIGHAYYKFYFFVRPDRLHTDWSRDRIVAEVNAAGVPCFSGSCSEIYLEKAFPELWRPSERLANARELGETSVMCLVHPNLTDQQMEITALKLREVVQIASR